MKAQCLRLAAIALSLAVLAACSTVPFGGDIVNSHINAAGIGYSPVTGVTAGYLATNHTFVPVMAKDSKGDIVPVTYADGCGRSGPPVVSSIQAGNATANATTNTGGTAANAPSVQVAVAVNQGLLTGDAARLDELAKLQAAGAKGNLLTEYNACPQATPTQAAQPAIGTPVP